MLNQRTRRKRLQDSSVAASTCGQLSSRDGLAPMAKVAFLAHSKQFDRRKSGV
jgi:hypothetical protein